MNFGAGGMGGHRAVLRSGMEAVEFMHHCSTKWATFLWSLLDALEQGENRPAPHDLKIHVGDGTAARNRSVRFHLIPGFGFTHAERGMALHKQRVPSD